MAQTNSGTGNGNFSSSVGVSVASGETTVLDAVPAFGFYRYGITITNTSGSTTACALYGSMDGTNYIAVSGFSTFAVSTGTTGHAEASGVWQYLRLTCTGVSTVNAYLNAIVG